MEPVNKLTLKIDVQDAVLSALVNAAFSAEDANKIELADGIRNEAIKLAKKWKVKDISGLPKTWNHPKRISSYR